MSREETFWNRVIELSKKTFKKEIFDYFVLTSRLIKVDQQEAVIYLDAEVKKLFWEENMTKVILTAGFEIYAVELTISYQFNLEEEEEEKEFIPLSEINQRLCSEPCSNSRFASYPNRIKKEIHL